MGDELLLAVKRKCRELYMERQPAALLDWVRSNGDLPSAVVARFNIHAIGIAIKRRNGQETGEICIQVAVLRKFRTPEEVVRFGGIPIERQLDGVPIDIVEASPLVIEEHSGRHLEPQASQAFRPLRPGCWISHGNVNSGTLGAFCRSTSEADRGRVFLLSCRHVLAGFEEPPPGENPIRLEIFQPGGSNAAANRVSPEVERLIDEMQPSTDPPRYVGDAAIAPLEPGIDFNTDNLGIGRPAGIMDLQKLAASNLLQADQYVKFGRATGMTVGTLKVVKRDTRAVFGGRQRVFDDQFVVRRLPGAAVPMSDPGDSGAMMFHKATRMAAGIVIGAPKGPENDEETVISPLTPILKELEVELVLDHP